MSGYFSIGGSLYWGRFPLYTLHYRLNYSRDEASTVQYRVFSKGKSHEIGKCDMIFWDMSV